MAALEGETSVNLNSTVPNVFDAGLPTFNYGLTATPHDILEDVRAAQSRAPIAIGPLGPEILSYDLAREILRDNRFRLPPGITLAAQGITGRTLVYRGVTYNNVMLWEVGEPIELQTAGTDFEVTLEFRRAP